MKEDYDAEKDAEIDKLEATISSTQKLWQKAIDYIRDNWGDLKNQLISWNTEFGTSLNSEIEDAWSAAESAAERYGDFVTAILHGIQDEIDRITEKINAINGDGPSFSGGPSGQSGGDSGGKSNSALGEARNNGSHSKEDDVHAAISEMYQNSQTWFNASDSQRKQLADRNHDLGEHLKSLFKII